MIEPLIRVLGRIRMVFQPDRKPEWAEKGVIPIGFIKKFLPENPVVIEAGAHIGLDTVQMSKSWPNGTIYAFEPIPELFERLKANTRKLKNVNCHPLALADSVTVAKMFVSSGVSDGSSSLLPPKEHLTEHPDVYFQTEIEVQTTTLDDWVRKHGVQRVDFLWLDMQGSELAALKAAPLVLSLVRAIYIEVSLKEMYEGVPLYPEVREWLEIRGFRVEREELPWPDMGNVLFVRQIQTAGTPIKAYASEQSD